MIFLLLCLVFLPRVAYGQEGRREIESSLKKLALTPMPEYESLRDEIVKGISLEELDGLKPDMVLVKIMIPIIKLHKQHKELVDLFNALWSTRIVNLEALGVKRPPFIPAPMSKGVPTGIPPSRRAYIEAGVAAFIWPFKGMLQKDLSLASKKKRAYWAKIVVLEYLLKYERDSRFEKFFDMFESPIPGLDFTASRRFVEFRYLDDLNRYKDGPGDAGDILIPAPSGSNARTLYDACVLDFLLQYCHLIPRTVDFGRKQDPDILATLILKLYRSKPYSALKTIEMVKKSLPPETLGRFPRLTPYSSQNGVPKMSINDLLNKLIAELSKKKCEQIDWIGELSKMEKASWKRHSDAKGKTY